MLNRRTSRRWKGALPRGLGWVLAAVGRVWLRVVVVVTSTGANRCTPLLAKETRLLWLPDARFLVRVAWSRLAARSVEGTGVLDRRPAGVWMRNRESGTGRLYLGPAVGRVRLSRLEGSVGGTREGDGRGQRGISASLHDQARPVRCACRTTRGHTACTQLLGKVGEQQRLIGVVQQQVTRSEVDPAQSGPQPGQQAGAGPAAAPPINGVLEQQQVHQGTGPVPNRANFLDGARSGSHGLAQGLKDEPMTGINSPPRAGHGHHLRTTEVRASGTATMFLPCPGRVASVIAT
jgi:hypothetical protein